MLDIKQNRSFVGWRTVGVASLLLGLCACASDGVTDEALEPPAVAEPGAAAEPDASAALHSERAGIGLEELPLAGPGAAAVVIDPRRSLAVTDQAIVGSFPLGNVLNQLSFQGTGSTASAPLLFRQLWETQNPAPGQADLAPSAHCTDNGGTLNGFAYPCRPIEGQQAVPGGPGASAYQAIGLFNRFDLAPRNGANCGEYRAVFAKTSLAAGPGRNFIIFEAVLPNPQPALGLEGCRPVANFWRDLTTTASVTTRTTMLRTFYFNGIPGFSPVFHINNYGVGPSGAGQIRTNQFMQPPWLLREHKLQRTCVGATCTLKFVPQTVKTNPFGNLFNPSSTHPLAAQFQTTIFPGQVAALAVNNLNTFTMTIPAQFNVGQSDSQTGGAVVDNYVAQLGPAASPFRAAIQARLTALGSTLTPDQIVARAQTQSCGGCHQRSNGAVLGGGLVWPPSDNFVHNSEQAPEAGPDGLRFRLSPAMTSTFLPHRKAVLEAFLNAAP
jgi:hypothetical protein